MEPVHLSVRQLVEFLMQTGSIDSRFTGFDRAAEGARIHRKLQKQAGEGYQAEVYLKQTYTVAEVDYLIDGRADGIFTDENGVVTVDEIKTVTTPLHQIEENFKPVHWAQGQVYAAIYAAQNGLESIAVQLTYYQVEEEQIRRFTRSFTQQQLEEFVVDLLQQYAPWAKRANQWASARNQSLQALTFPFSEYRTGQRALAAAAYRTFRDGGRLLCQAPTGIGKTMSTLFPALKAMGEGHGERTFYLTARTTTRQAAESALELLRSHKSNLVLKSISLTAKDSICLLEQRECTPEACPYANGYYDRIRDALWQALDTDCFTKDSLQQLAKQYTVCPFELGLDLSLWCDVIVGDYNYLFDPVVSLKRFFESGGDYLFLVDEAHNLPDRAREMHSAALSKQQVYQVKKALGNGKSRLKAALTKLNNAFIEFRHQCEQTPAHTFFEQSACSSFNRLVANCTTPLEEWLEEHREGELHQTVLTLYFDLRSYLRVSERYDEHFITQISAFGSEVIVSQLCLDPSEFLDQNFASGRGSVVFSATLSPMNYYRDVLGCQTAQCAALPSPFSPSHLGLFCAGTVSTRYKDRAQSVPLVAQYLYGMCQGRTGNYMAFFPSYSYLQQVQEYFCQQYPQLDTYVQTPGMTEEEKHSFLERFTDCPTHTMLCFGVMGGIFGEGIDLAGNRLIGTAIVGVGLPQINPRQEVLREYFDRQLGNGFAYAYQYPGFNKVLQAAGRVIRTATDRGVVLLIDDRFTHQNYQNLFPNHWSHCRYLDSPERFSQQLTDFWQANEMETGRTAE